MYVTVFPKHVGFLGVSVGLPMFPVTVQMSEDNSAESPLWQDTEEIRSSANFPHSLCVSQSHTCGCGFSIGYTLEMVLLLLQPCFTPQYFLK